MKAIGGYPELELRKGEHYHKDAIKLNTARNCLEYILLARKYRKVYVPYYTCDAVLEPFSKPSLRQTKTEFYHITEELKPALLPELKDGEAFLYTNYFGLMQNTVEGLTEIYGNRLIVDNSQAFFDMPYPRIDTFYSARKFFGIPDGSYLYTDAVLEDYNGSEIETDRSFDRMDALLKRIDLGAESGYGDFQAIEHNLCLQPIKKMSRLTEAILSSIDYEQVKKRRQENYETLNFALAGINSIALEFNEKTVPLCYPLLDASSSLRRYLIAEKIFVPTYWPNVQKYCTENSLEYELVKNLVPLPIDQRYENNDMKRITLKILGEHSNLEKRGILYIKK
ncbi:MAG: hypothetical protein HDR88_13220 [Bacteroides sp.]|nr:hypothetical protein [Bacteroides sp.]